MTTPTPTDRDEARVLSAEQRLALQVLQKLSDLCRGHGLDPTLYRLFDRARTDIYQYGLPPLREGSL